MSRNPSSCSRLRRRIVLPLLASVLFGAAASALARQNEPPLPSWFPATALEGAGVQLAQGIRSVQEDATEEQIADAGRRGVRDLIFTVDGWGLEGLRERSPTFPELEIPTTDDPIVGLVATFGVCSLGVYEELAATPRERFYVKLVEVSVGVISAYLRTEALTAGATDDSLREALTSVEWQALSERLVEDEEARNHVNQQCGPVMSALLE